MITVSLAKAKEQMTKLLEEVEKGEEVIITNKSKPVAKLVSLAEASAESQRKLGSAKDKILIADDFDEPIDDFNSWLTNKKPDSEINSE